ncbi:HWE histidine kinase domain-containing protein [uncultured Thioclava sp.]|uniref:HWE histidine kinase domain-containing protein n=1 Tax=uncultured Thioclava sp. TaxID=473858 RepID=UPI0025F8DDE1|nr:HWE histidine kinase domain-containing protein [uncultured Thioclava sp.]
MDAPSQEAFDRATRLAARIVGTPVALVSLVDESRQFLLSQTGVDDSTAGLRETPLSHSFCRHVVENDSSLIVSDARQDPRVRDNGAVDDLNVIAYLGVPLRTIEGDVLGSFCVIGHEPRVWTDEDHATLLDLAAGVEAEIRLRRQTNLAHQEHEVFRAILDQMPIGVALAEAGTGRLLDANNTARNLMGAAVEVSAGLANSGLQAFDANGQPYSNEALPLNRAALRNEVITAEEVTIQQPGRAPLHLLISAHRIDSDPPLAVATLLNVTERKRAERNAFQSAERLAHFHEVTRDGILELDAENCVRYSNGVMRERVRRAHSAQLADALLGANILQEFPNLQGTELEAAMGRARATQQPQAADVVAHDSRVLEARLFPEDGTLLIYLRDVTDERAVAQAREILARELNHRVKNLFAMMSGLIGMTARHATSPASMAEGLRARINALARAHDLVSPTATLETGFRGEVDFDALIRAILAPYVSAQDLRVVLEGLPVLLNQAGATNFALVLHELATNAVKYGALSCETAKLHLSWQIVPGDEGPMLAFDWHESGCPERLEPPRPTGFGNRLIDLTIHGQLRGTYGTEWPADGFLARIHVPMELIKG